MAQAEHFLNFKVRKKKSASHKGATHISGAVHTWCVVETGKVVKVRSQRWSDSLGGCWKMAALLRCDTCGKPARKTHTSPVRVAPQNQKYACKRDHIELPSRNMHFFSKVLVSCRTLGDVTSQPTSLHLMSLICNSSVSLISPLSPSLPLISFQVDSIGLWRGKKKCYIELALPRFHSSYLVSAVSANYISTPSSSRTALMQ